MLFPTVSLEQTAIIYLPKVKSSSYLLYFFLLLSIVGGLTSLPFIHTDISIKTASIIHPVTERTKVKPVISGIIKNIFYKEGDKVQKRLSNT